MSGVLKKGSDVIENREAKQK